MDEHEVDEPEVDEPEVDEPKVDRSETEWPEIDRSDALVAAQAAALAGVLWPGRPRWDLPVGLGAAASALIVAGGTLALAGAAPHTRLTPRVRPPAGAPLVTTGAYALTRNPIYVGLTAGA